MASDNGVDKYYGNNLMSNCVHASFESENHVVTRGLEAVSLGSPLSVSRGPQNATLRNDSEDLGSNEVTSETDLEHIKAAEFEASLNRDILSRRLNEALQLNGDKLPWRPNIDYYNLPPRPDGVSKLSYELAILGAARGSPVPHPFRHRRAKEALQLNGDNLPRKLNGTSRLPHVLAPKRGYPVPHPHHHRRLNESHRRAIRCSSPPSAVMVDANEASASVPMSPI